MITETTQIFNTLVLYEKTLKNRVKNLKGANIDIVPLDEKKKLDKYTKYYSNDGYRIEYQLPELKDYGRIKQVPYTGLGTFCKEVRGYLANGIYIDVDMVNCHPVILNDVFKREGIDTEIIEEYVSKRDEFLIAEKSSKEEFLKIINKETFYGIGKLKTLHTQIYDLLLPKIFKICPKMTEKIKRSKVENKNGKIVANYLQDIEFKILSELYKFGSENDLLIDTLMHDGFFIRITDIVSEKYIEENFTKKFEDLVKTKFGISMKFKIKKHDTTITFEDEQNTYIDYNQVKKEFEKNHSKIINKSFFIKETEDNYISVLTEKALIVSYKHLVYEKMNDDGEKERKSFIKDWLMDPSMRLYEDMDCFPNESKCPKNKFNTWRKFEMEFIDKYTHKKAELDEILMHIKILCKHDPEVYNYFVNWIGQMIQYPEVKSICPILISKEGAGKGTLISLFRKMLGANKIMEPTDPSRDVWGNFNGKMADSFLVAINEIGKKDTMDSVGKIKGLITDSELIVNSKGVNAFSIRSFHRFIMTTNNFEPIETSMDDRRNFIIRSSDEKIGDKDYFTRINEVLLNDVDVIKTCYEYFKALPNLDKFGTLKMPKTEHQRNLQEMSVSPIELWIKDLVSCSKKDIIEMTGQESLESFKTYCEYNGFKYEINSIKLGIRINSLEINGIRKGKHTMYGSTKIFDIKVMKLHFNPTHSLFVDNI